MQVKVHPVTSSTFCSKASLVRINMVFQVGLGEMDAGCMCAN